MHVWMVSMHGDGKYACVDGKYAYMWIVSMHVDGMDVPRQRESFLKTMTVSDKSASLHQ